MAGAGDGRRSAKKKAGSGTACPKGRGIGSDVGLGLAETLHAVTGLPLTALPEQIDALKALQDVALHDETRGTLEAFVL
jgi:hypothetical protein